MKTVLLPDSTARNSSTVRWPAPPRCGGLALLGLCLAALFLAGCARKSAAPVSAKMQAVPGASAVPLDGLRLWLSAAVGLAPQGTISNWPDQSGLGHDAVQPNPEHQPEVVSNQVANLPAVHFTASKNESLLIRDLMAGATSGEAFAVVRRSKAETVVGLWAFGGAGGSRYPESNGQLNDDFASDTWRNTVPAPADLNQFHVYDVGGDSSVWFQYFDGREHFRQSGNTVKFRSVPTLGDGQGCFFDGDFAEVIVYDRVLSDAERKAVTGYLMQRYALPPK